MKCYVNDEFISVEKISYRIFGLGNEVNDLTCAVKCKTLCSDP